MPLHLSSLTLTWRRRPPLLTEMPLQPAQVSLTHPLLSTAFIQLKSLNLKDAKDCSELIYAITAVRCSCTRPYLCLCNLSVCVLLLVQMQTGLSETEKIACVLSCTVMLR